MIVASGHAMKGIALAPVTGRLVAELAPDAPDKDFGLAMAGELELRAS